MKVELINRMGTDLTVVNAARVSFDKESTWVQQGYVPDSEEMVLDGIEREARYMPYEGYYPLSYDEAGVELTGFMLSNRDAKLIRYLADNNHWTPFAHCMITMRETMPIFLARQRFKHMVGFTYNEVSRRYVDSEPEFYTPKVWRKKAEDKKQGSSDEAVDEIDVVNREQTVITAPVRDVYRELVDYCEEVYNEMLASGVCPEQARMVLPQSMMTSYYVTGSLPAWARAYKQRTHEHAQREWDEITAQWDSVIRTLFPQSWSALVDNS